jgi:hypothetical protein
MMVEDRNGSAQVPVAISALTPDAVRFWTREVQPDIGRSDRADRRWNWNLIYVLAAISTGGVGLSVSTQDRHGVLKPIGLYVGLDRFPWLPDAAQQSTFIWFITSAPSERLTALGIDSSPKIGTLLVDLARASSIANGSQGRIGLHAHPKGGPQLLDFYRHKCGLTALERTVKLPGAVMTWKHRLLNRPYYNDGRFFYA